MPEDIKILNGRKYEKRDGQWYDIGPAEVQKELNGRLYENRGGQWYDIGQAEQKGEEVKKKENPLSSVGSAASGSDGLSTLGDAIGAGGKGTPEIESVKDKISRDLGGDVKPKKTVSDTKPKFSEEDYSKKPTLSFGIIDSPEVLDIDGNKFPVYPEYLPEGYMRDEYGVKKFIADKKAEYEATPQENRKSVMLSIVPTVSQSVSKNNPEVNKSRVNDFELSEISKLIGRQAGRDIETIQALKDAREKMLDDERMKIFEESGRPALAATVSLNEDKYSERYDYYISKLTKQLQKEVDKNASAVVMGADMRNAWNRMTSSIDSNIKNIIDRTKTENLGNSFFTGLESEKLINNGRYEQIKRRVSEGKTVSSAIVSEMTARGNSIIKARMLDDLGNGLIDPESFLKKEDELGMESERNFWNRPDLVQKEVASVIAEYHAEAKRSTAAKIMNVAFGEWQIDDDEIDEVPADYFESKGIDPRRPEFKNAIENIKKQEGGFLWQNAVQKDGLTRELVRGAWTPIKGVAGFVEGMAKTDDEKRLDNELDPIQNYVQQRTDYFNAHYGMLADAFNGLGQFVTQYLLMELGIGAFKNIGIATGGKVLPKAATITRPAAGVEASVARGGTGAGNFLIDNSKIMGQIAVPYLQSYDQYHKQALEKTDNAVAAKLYGAVNAGMEAASELMFDNVDFARKVVRGFRGEFEPRQIAKLIANGLDDKAENKIRGLIQDKLKNAVSAVAEGAGNLAKESFEEVPVALTNFVMDAIVAPDSINGRDVFSEMYDSFTAGLVSFSIPAIVGAGVKAKSMFANKTTQSDALMMAVQNRSDVIDALYNLAEDGKISNDDLNSKISMLNTATTVFRNMPKAYADGSPMFEKDRVAYMSSLVNERYLTDAASKLEKEDPERKIIEGKIAETRAERETILMSDINAEDSRLYHELLNKAVEGKDISEVTSLTENIVKLEGDNGYFIPSSAKKYGLEKAAKLAESDPDSFIEKYGSSLYNKIADRFILSKAPSGPSGSQMRNPDEREVITPQEKIIELANKKQLAGWYSELLQERPDMADDVILDYAKQKFGISDDGTELKGGGREISSEVSPIVSRLYPDKKSVIDAIGVSMKEEEKEVKTEKVDNGITVGEMIDRTGSYKGMAGQFYVDEGEVVFKENGRKKEYVLGKEEEVSTRPIDDFGIQHEESVVLSEDDGFVVRGKKYVNNYSDPGMAIEETKDGFSVSLETQDGKKRTFRGSIAEDIAYQINLKKIAKDEKSFEQFANSDTEASEIIQDGGYTEVAQEDTVGADAEIQREEIVPATEEVRAEIRQIEDEANKDIVSIEENAEAQKNEAIKASLKPEISLEFVNDVELVKKNVSATLKQDEVKKKFDNLLKLVECCYA